MPAKRTLRLTHEETTRNWRAYAKLVLPWEIDRALAREGLEHVPESLVGVLRERGAATTYTFDVRLLSGANVGYDANGSPCEEWPT